MGLSLIAAWFDIFLTLDGWKWVFEAAVALGMVIFVHELGHFLVAKWCGVKCEKFYLGFDIYGLKLFKYQWGETEYGIGALPLGGYVKMLGQDDNPGRAAQERERSTLHADQGEPNLADVAETGRVAAGGSGQALDPRSYLAKSVPQRMAIISAGVIMNVIFAFVCAVAAYTIGVPETACGVSAVAPGQTAWRAGLQPGDRILEIEGHEGPLPFRDLMSTVALADLANGVDFRIERPGVAEPFWVNLKPEKRNGLMPTIGVASPLVNTLERNPIVEGGSPAAAAGLFQQGDTIVAVDGQGVHSHAELVAALNRHDSEKLTVTIERKAPGAGGTVQRLDVPLEPQHRRTLGLVMTMGEITAVQEKSPAAEAGLRAGDIIETVDGQAPGDPLRWPDTLRGRAGQTVKLVVARPTSAGQVETLEKEVTLSDWPWPLEAYLPGMPVGVPALGLSYQVLAKIREVVPDGPAAGAKLAPGDEVVGVAFRLPDVSDEERKRRAATPSEAWLSEVPGALEISDEKPNWPFLMYVLQRFLPVGTKVELTLADGRHVELVSAEAGDWYDFDRGLRCAPEKMVVRADSFAQAVALGGRETKNSLLLVYKFLDRLMSRQVSPMALGGPVTIVKAASSAASEGLPSLLLFVTLLSANLAVINFLPIPLLDGGHMVFLILEGILRRPVSEKVVIAFHYAGFVFIISLMLFVLSLDFGLIPRT